MKREDLSKAAARSVSRREFINRSGILAAGSALTDHLGRGPGVELPVLPEHRHAQRNQPSPGRG